MNNQYFYPNFLYTYIAFFDRHYNVIFWRSNGTNTSQSDPLYTMCFTSQGMALWSHGNNFLGGSEFSPPVIIRPHLMHAGLDPYTTCYLTPFFIIFA